MTKPRMSLEHVNAVLFDKDGTLLDFVELWGSWLTALEAQFQSHLNKIGAIDRRPFGDSGLGVTFNSDGKPIDYSHVGPMSAGTMDEIEAILAWHLWKRDIAWQDAVDTVKKSIAAVEQELNQTRPISPVRGLRPFIEQLRAHGIHLAVVTSDSTSSAKRHLEWLQLRDAFSVVIGRDGVPIGKPEPDMIYAACQQLGVLPQDVVLIGDSEIDMEMGRRAGVQLSIQIDPNGAAPVQNSKRWTVRDYTDLLDLG